MTDQACRGTVPTFVVNFIIYELEVTFYYLTPKTAPSLTADASDTGKNSKAQKSQPLGYERKEQAAA